MLSLVKNMFKQKITVQIWTLLLVIVNLIAPIFVIEQWQAQLSIGCFLVIAGLMTYLHGKFGFSKILGLAHIIWVPMLVIIMNKTILVQLDELAAIWVCCLISLNFMSLILDARDVWKWVKGDRDPVI